MIATDDLKPIIGANIRRLRESLGLSQGELAGRAGCHWVNINRIENGHVAPGAALLYSLADALGVSADSLRQACEKKSR